NIYAIVLAVRAITKGLRSPAVISPEQNKNMLYCAGACSLGKKPMKKVILPVLFGSAFLCPGLAFADEPVETQIVDTMNKLFGVHPGFRANHAKGLVVEGSFKASPEAAALSKAVHFNGSTIPLIARFSDATGVPNIPDGSPNANPHGIAIKFHLPDG